MANIHVEDQRPSDAHYVTKPRTQERLFIFVEYEYGPVTQSDEDNGLEWWFPRSNGDGYPSIVHNGTVWMPDGADSVRLYLQDPEGEIRVLVAKLNPLLTVEAIPCTFITPHNSRGVIVFERPDKDQIFKVSYLVERV